MALIPYIHELNVVEINRVLRKLASSKLGPTAIPTFAGASIGTLTLADGSITDSSGAIDFGDENLSTSGNLTLSGLTTGRVLFSGTGGVLSDDAALFWDDTNKRLGIGTASPQQLLHLFADNAIMNEAIRLQNTGSSVGDEIGIYFRHWADGRLQAFIKDEITSGWPTKLHFGIATGVNNAATKMTIDESGNVGIGEQSPQDKLEVNGKILVKDKLCFTQDDRNEYIDSLADGYMDYGATTGHRFNTTIAVTGNITVTGTVDGIDIATDVAANTTHRGIGSGNPHSVTPAELNLVIGTNTQAFSAALDDLTNIGIVTGDNYFLVGQGAGALAWELGATARTSIDLGSTSIPQFAGLGIGIAGPIPLVGLLKIYKNAVNTSTTYLGIYNYHQKTSGITDYNDSFCGIYNVARYNQSGGVLGNGSAIFNVFQLTDGDIGDASNERYIETVYNFTDLDGGKIYGKVFGLYTEIDQEAANEVTGSIYGHYIDIDADGTVGGSVVGLFLKEGSNVDYGIFQLGSADNYLGGRLGVGIYPKTKLTVTGTITLQEQAAADGSSAAYGQIWVKIATPNELWFTDDTDVSHQIAFV